MLLSLPKTNAVNWSGIVIMTIVVHVALAWLLKSMLVPSLPESNLIHVPIYQVKNQRQQQPEVELEIQEITTSEKPSAAPPAPKLMTMSLLETTTTFTLPKVTFSADLTEEFDMALTYDVSQSAVGDGSQFQSKITLAKPTFQVPIQYPPRAKSKNIEGSVTLDLYIDESGKPLRHRVVAEEPEGVFLQALLRSVLRWRFEPPKTGASQWQRVSIDFELD